MGANGSRQPVTTSPIPIYPPSAGPPQGQWAPSGPYGPPGPGSLGPAGLDPNGPPGRYYSRPPPDAGYGPPGSYGPPPPMGRPGPTPAGRRFGPPPPLGGNSRPPVRLGDRNFGPLGGPSDQSAGLQPRGNYPPDLQRILEDDDDIFADEDAFLAKPPQRPNFADPSQVEQYALSKMYKHGLQPEQANRYFNRPPGSRGFSEGQVQPTREPQYRARPQVYHLQPQGEEQYTFRYDPITGELAADPKPGISEIGGYRVESYNLPPAFGNGPPPPQLLGFPPSAAPPATIQVPGLPPVFAGGFPQGGAPPQVFAGPYGAGQGPIVVPGNY